MKDIGIRYSMISQHVCFVDHVMYHEIDYIEIELILAQLFEYTITVPAC